MNEILIFFNLNCHCSRSSLPTNLNRQHLRPYNTMSSNNGGGDEEQLEKMVELSKTLKGERIIPPTRRPDGSLRKPIRIRAGYVPQDEVPIYQSKGALWKKEMASQAGPPGYDPPTNAKPKEKRLQAAVEKGKDLEEVADDEIKREDDVLEEYLDDESKPVKSLTSQMTDLSFSASPVSNSPPSNAVKTSEAGTPVLDLDKKIRALKNKIRLAEAQQQKTPQQDMKPEQLEKLAELEGWQEELKLLEDKKAELAAL